MVEWAHYCDGPDECHYCRAVRRRRGLKLIFGAVTAVIMVPVLIAMWMQESDSDARNHAAEPTAPPTEEEVRPLLADALERYSAALASGADEALVENVCEAERFRSSRDMHFTTRNRDGSTPVSISLDDRSHTIELTRDEARARIVVTSAPAGGGDPVEYTTDETFREDHGRWNVCESATVR